MSVYLTIQQLLQQSLFVIKYCKLKTKQIGLLAQVVSSSYSQSSKKAISKKYIIFKRHKFQMSFIDAT